MSEEQPQQQSSMYNSEVNYFGLTNYRNQFRKFGIKTDDRRRHMYVIGKTGMGKTTILENMVLNDIYAGHGIGLVDPHGDFAEKVLNYVPPHRINDIVYFNPSDMDCPVGFNILESVNEEYRHLIASGLMGVFKKIWPDVWSARMEYIMNNSILALIGYPDATLMGINRMLSDEDYRDKVIAMVKDPVVKAFWDVEFASYSDKYKQEAVAPIQNKIGQFLSASIIRNIVAQVKSTINIREIMDTKKIFIMNLSKGRIGEDSSRLLGGMLITKIQLSAMERVDTPEKERKDFFLYVDEFQNFATESFAGILSEARKYRLDLIMAHQYMEQLEEGVRAAVIGNVGTMAVFRVGSTDADILVKEFAPTFTEEDLVNLPKFHIYLKLMIDGVASRPFSALTLPPIAAATGSLEKVLRVSRERYGTPRAVIEEKIAKWSGVFEDKPPSSSGGGSSNGGSGGGSKSGGSSKPSSGNKSGGGGGNKSSGGKSGGGSSKSFSSGSKGNPPPRSAPPKLTSAPPPVTQTIVSDIAPQPAVSLSQIVKPAPVANQPPQQEVKSPESAEVPQAQPIQSQPAPIVTAPKPLSPTEASTPVQSVPLAPSLPQQLETKPLQQNIPQQNPVQQEPLKDEKIISISSSINQESSVQSPVANPQPIINPSTHQEQKNDLASQSLISQLPKSQPERPSQSSTPQQSKRSSPQSQQVSNQPRKPQQKQSSQSQSTSSVQNPLKNSQGRQSSQPSPKPPQPSQQPTQATRQNQSSDRRSEKQNRPMSTPPRKEIRNNEQKSEKTVSLQELSKKNSLPPRDNQKSQVSSSTLPHTPPPSVAPQITLPSDNSSSAIIQPKTLNPGEVAKIE